MSKQINFTLTKNELEIMNVLWRNEKPLTANEIINLSENPSWKASSIHVLIKALINKCAIENVGVELVGNKYSRTFSPTIDSTQYYAMQFTNSLSYKKSKKGALLGIFSALLDNDIFDKNNEGDKEFDGFIDELEKMIQCKKEE